MKCFLVLAACIVGYLAQEDSGPAFRFSAEPETYLYQPLSREFSCEGREYGYYADVNNNCQVFHICLPINDPEGNPLPTLQWSFLCGNQTVFDQSTLTCNHINDAFPCEQSESIYNEVQFGVIPEDNK